MYYFTHFPLKLPFFYLSFDSGGGKIVKALKLFQCAGDYDRTCVLLDRAMWRCCTALVNTSYALSSNQADLGSNSRSADLGSNSRQMDLGSSSRQVDQEDEKKMSSRLLFLIPRNLKMYPVYPRGAVVLGEETEIECGLSHIDMRHYVEAGCESEVGGEGMSESESEGRMTVNEIDLGKEIFIMYLRASLLDLYI